MLIPDAPKPQRYTCPRCNKTWQQTKEGMYMVCAVMHQPGTCCHFRENEVTEKPTDPKEKR